MKIDENSMIPIYVQIADSIEDDISMISERKRHSEVEQIAEQLIKLSKKLSITKEELLKLIAEQYDKK